MAIGDADPKKRNAKAKPAPKERVQPKKKLMPRPPQAPPPRKLLADRQSQQLVPVKEETMEFYDGQTVQMPPPPPPTSPWPQAALPGSFPKSVSLLGLSSMGMAGGSLVPPVVAPPPMNPPAAAATAPVAAVAAPPATPVVVPPPVVIPPPVASADNGSAPAELEKLRNSMSSIRDENAALKAELFEWRRDAAKNREAEHALEQARAAQLEAQARQAQDSEDLVRDQLTEMEKRKSRLEYQLSEAESQLKEAQRENSGLQKENSVLRTHRDLLTREMKDSGPVKAEIEAARSEISVLHGQLEKLKEENEALRAKASEEDNEKWKKHQMLLERYSSALKASFTSQLTALQVLKNESRDVVNANGDIAVQNSDAVKEVIADPQLSVLLEALSGSSDKQTLEHAIESLRELSKSKGFVVPTTDGDTATEIMEDSDKEAEAESEKEAEAESDDSDKGKNTGDEKDSDEEKSSKGKGIRSKSRSCRRSSRRRKRRRRQRSVSTNSL
mmetsp:Transcript_54520/g.119362  ORF Transcript_54520/g.119362 Transcript_54520/m.119362 type:complete len:501 (-) Transcript_54520:61-1563(-)